MAPMAMFQYLTAGHWQPGKEVCTILSVSGMIAGAGLVGVYEAVWSIRRKLAVKHFVCTEYVHLICREPRGSWNYRSGWLPPTNLLRTVTSYPDGLIYRLTVVGALHASRSHSLPQFKYIADPNTLLFLGSWDSSFPVAK